MQSSFLRDKKTTMTNAGEVPRGSRTATAMQSRFYQTNSRDIKGNYVACSNVTITCAKGRVGEGRYSDNTRTEQETQMYYSLLNDNGSVYQYV
jgi:hypothetical protein